MESEGSLPHSQELATCHFSKPDKSGPCPHTTPLRSILILSPHIGLGFPSGLYSSGLPHKNPLRICLASHTATYLAHLIFLDFIVQKYLVKSAENIGPSFVVFSILLLLPP